MSFQIIGIPYEPFAPLFALSDAELAARRALRVVATEARGFPCRVSLVDAAIGEELLLLPFEHQPARSPYHATGPIFVRRAARPAIVEPGVIPACVRGRLMSVRAYDSADLMIETAVCDGDDAAAVLTSQLANPAVSYIHLHNARPGCFSCAVQRVRG